MKIVVRIPRAGVSTAGAVLSIDGGTTYYPVAYNVNTVFTSHFPVGSTKLFTFNSTQTMKCYPTSSSSGVTVTGVWQADADYNTDSLIVRGVKAYYFRPYAAQTIYKYKLVALDQNRKLVPLVTNDNTTDPLAAVTTLTPTTQGFRPDKIFWYMGTATISSGSRVAADTLMTDGHSATNMALCNFNNGAAANNMIYLCGTYNTTTGLFTLRSGNNYFLLAAQNGTANFTSGYDYIFLGSTYSTAHYIWLREENPMYHYDGTNLIPYDTWRINNLQGTDIGSGSASSGQVLTADGSGGSSWSSVPSGAFVATYNTTTFAEVYAAYSAGRVCVVKDPVNPYIHVLDQVLNDSTAIRFSYHDTATSSYITVAPTDYWSISTQTIQGTDIKSGTTGSYATSGQVLTANGSGASSWQTLPTEVFWVTYNSTPFADLYSAFNAGKLCVMKGAHEGAICTYVNDDGQGNTSAFFYGTYYNTAREIEYMNGTWSWRERDLNAMYWCEPNSTLFTNILAAIGDNRVPIIVDLVNGRGYYVTGLRMDTSISQDYPIEVTFRSYDSGHIYEWTVDYTDTWTSNTSSIASIFLATYGSTSYSAIASAYAAGKTCAVVYGGLTYLLTSFSAQGMIFACDDTTQHYYITVDDSSVWASGSSLLGTVKSVNNISPNSSGNVTLTIPSSTFVAEYGVTTYAEIAAAALAEKAVAMTYSDNGTTYVGWLDEISASQASFRLLSNYSVIQAYCNASNDSWTMSVYPFSKDPVYFCTPNSTTFNDIYGAVTNSQVPVISDTTNGRVYYVAGYGLTSGIPTSIIFRSYDATNVYEWTVDGQDNWTSNQSGLVSTSGDQTIDGTKTFVERPLYPNTVTLPSGYTQLEYIHSDGTAYINTGRKYSTDDSVELIFQQDDTANYRIWGTFNQSSYSGKNVSMTYSVGWCVRQETRDGQAAMVTLGTIDTKKHTLKILPSGHCYFDGVDYGKSDGWAANFTFSYNAYLFTINPGGTTPSATMKGRVYRYRVWRSGALVQDMYPVKYESGGTTTYGMYDVVNSTYYTNANSSGTLTGAGTPTPTPMVFEDDLSQVAFSGDYNDLNNLPTIPTNYVTTNTAQTVSATKTFTAQQKFQSGSPSGCVVFGANVSATTVSAGTRKLARLTVPTYETNGSSVVGFVSIDNNAYSGGGGNQVEFGSRNGDSTSFGPDLIAFSVATSHNVSTRNNIAQYQPSKVQFFNHASGSTSIQQTPNLNLIGMWEFNNNNTFVNNAYTYTLPNTTGTIALTSNIPSIPVTDVQINGTSILSSGTANILTNTAYDSSTNKIATMSDVPSVPSWALASTKPSYALNEISGTDDLQAIEGLTGTSGLLKKTAANTWSLDTSSYLVNPMSALGDLIYGNADGSAGVRLALGTSGQVLTSDGSTPVWGSVTTSGISSGSATSGYVLTADGSGGVSWAAGGGSGTVTSVDGSGSDGISVTGGPITSSGTLSVGVDSSHKLLTTTEWGTVVTATQNNSVSVAGTTKTTYKYDKTTIFAPNGLIMGGTAAAAGLVTRGICGVTTPNSTTGAATKDNLFLNYDGDNTYRNGRQIVIQAGSVGTHYGSNVYQYCAVRGDALKGWIEGKFPNTTTANKVLLSTTTSGTTAWSSWSTGGLLKTDTSGVVSVDTNAYITNPLTTAGDIFVGGTSGAPDRLGIGSNNNVLQVASGALSWGGVSSASIDSTGASSGQVLTADGSNGASWQSITHPSDIFEVTYGTTTYSDILTAYNAGKVCIMKYNDLVYTLSYCPISGGAMFSCVSGNTKYYADVDETDTWSNSSQLIGTVKSVNNTSPDSSGNVSITIPTYNFSGTTFYSGNQNTAEHNANNMTKNGVYYIGNNNNGPATTLGVQSADSSCFVQAYSDVWVTQISQDYRDGQIFVRSKKNNVWQPWMAVPFFTTSDGGKGSPTKPVYISNQNQSVSGSTNGQILECTYSLEANVPSNAVFTDTNQTVKTSSVTFSGDDAVEFVGSNNVTVTGNASAKTITIGGSDVFVATYGTTTYADIVAAHTANKICVVNYNELLYIISQPDTVSGQLDFTAVANGTVYTLSVTSTNTWTASSQVIVKSVNNVTPGSNGNVTIPGLPTVTSADAGKILMVDSNGNWVAATMAQWQLGGSY